jgi:hypothetical protein
MMHDASGPVILSKNARLKSKSIANKCKLEGESKEFISIQMKQDLKNGTTELTQPDYWEKSVERFKQCLGREPKERSTPLSVTDYNLLKEATDEEVKEAI